MVVYPCFILLLKNEVGIWNNVDITAILYKLSSDGYIYRMIIKNILNVNFMISRVIDLLQLVL